MAAHKAHTRSLITLNYGIWDPANAPLPKFVKIAPQTYPLRANLDNFGACTPTLMHHNGEIWHDAVGLQFAPCKIL